MNRFPFITITTAAAAAALLSLCLAGCGGGGGGEDDRAPTGPRNPTAVRSAVLGDGDDFTLVDGTLADVYEYTAPYDTDVVVTLISPAFDPYLVVQERFADGSLSVITHRDDISPQDYNAQLSFRAVGGATYQIIANSFPYAQGPYTLTLADNLADPSQVGGGSLPDAALNPPPAGQDRTLRGIRKTPGNASKRSVAVKGGRQ